MHNLWLKANAYQSENMYKMNALSKYVLNFLDISATVIVKA